jgi:hypothetical protein
MVADLKVKQGDAIVGFMKAFNTFQEDQFKKDLSGTLLDVSYGLSPEDLDSPPLSPIKNAFTEFKKEIYQKPWKDKQFFVEFFNDVPNPDDYTRYFPDITPLDRDAFNTDGSLGLLNALVHERGKLGGMAQFGRAMMASAAFKGLLLLAAALFFGNYWWQKRHGGGGDMPQLTILDPDKSAIEEGPKTEDEKDASVESLYDNESFNPYDPHLLAEKKDPAHPERNPSPCDPDHFIRTHLAALLKTGKYKNYGELNDDNEAFHYQAIQQVELLGDDPSTGCKERFIESFRDSN